jgi:hypothetical protein
MTPEIHRFLKELLIDAGQTGLGEEVENQLIEDLYSRLEDRLILTAMASLPPDKQRELEEIAANKKQDPKKVEAFLMENIPDYAKVIGTALADFRNTYIEAVG